MSHFSKHETPLSGFPKIAIDFHSDYFLMVQKGISSKLGETRITVKNHNEEVGDKKKQIIFSSQLNFVTFLYFHVTFKLLLLLIVQILNTFEDSGVCRTYTQRPNAAEL